MQWGYRIHDLRATINWALSAMPKIILYDFPSREPCAAWLPSAWKARMALNYKKIDYETQWVEYPDVAPLAKSLLVCIPPGEGPGLPYTIPIMTTAGGEHIMDSKKIVDYLEEHYAPPDYPSLHLDSPILARVTEQMPGIMQRWASSVFPRNLLNPRSAEYYERTRKGFFGISLEEFGRQKSGEAWAELDATWGGLAALLRATEGPYFMGDIVSYADLQLVAILHWAKRADVSVFERLVAFEPAFRMIYEAAAPLLEQDT
ncbi:uncharacterized protein CC84DRAFT_1096729 [Paraphaeosphaeria sporulosa]|uniref:Uncharacterized protein n=1 Tax=Paraphaeosphaeria sporulosa TaxID=1460663 RepID=A0A177C5R1_9PLEO|nr:uncharacterized protein CC84DRAFT_1096729 [Paraphaeosphaeria sporulosa]OAG03094.1 hypothetical protein CC84DRAFT_1096729 [Paraphaeosphaeria sporulosa]